MKFLEMHIETRHPNSPQNAGTGPKTSKAGGWDGVDRRAPVKGPRAAFERLDNSFVHRQDSPAQLFLLRETNRLLDSTSRSMDDRLNALYCLQEGIVDAVALRRVIAI